MRTILYIAPALLAAACASQDAKNETARVERSEARAPLASTASSSTTRSGAESRVMGNPLHDPSNILAKRSVYFDFDSNVVKDEYQPLIQAHSRFMTSHAATRVRIEGNSDERGSREYNLALGQRRAEAVKQLMVVLGTPSDQMETVSFGEEKPAATGHGEASWVKNRRDDIRYVAE